MTICVKKNMSRFIFITMALMCFSLYSSESSDTHENTDDAKMIFAYFTKKNSITTSDIKVEKIVDSDIQFAYPKYRFYRVFLPLNNSRRPVDDRFQRASLQSMDLISLDQQNQLMVRGLHISKLKEGLRKTTDESELKTIAVAIFKLLTTNNNEPIISKDQIDLKESDQNSSQWLATAKIPFKDKENSYYLYKASFNQQGECLKASKMMTGQGTLSTMPFRLGTPDIKKVSILLGLENSDKIRELETLLKAWDDHFHSLKTFYKSEIDLILKQNQTQGIAINSIIKTEVDFLSEGWKTFKVDLHKELETLAKQKDKIDSALNILSHRYGDYGQVTTHTMLLNGKPIIHKSLGAGLVN